MMFFVHAEVFDPALPTLDPFPSIISTPSIPSVQLSARTLRGWYPLVLL